MKGRRRRKPTPKPGELLIWYGQLEKYDRPDLVAAWGGHGATSSDGRLVVYSLAPPDWMKKDGSLLKELEARGYDLETLEFRIRKKRSIEEAL